MESDPLRYDRWVEEALRGVIRRALELTVVEGLPGDHHFFISFQTDHPDVSIPDRLTAEHPQEMTIVLQHQFDDLVVSADGFQVTLSFSGRASRLCIPFSAVTSFADPAVNFGLQLKMMAEGEAFDDDLDDDAEDEAALEDGTGADGADRDADEADKMGEVIALDAFRKK